jgi:ABC-type Fe3+ transport system permease subunit
MPLNAFNTAVAVAGVAAVVGGAVAYRAKATLPFKAWLREATTPCPLTRDHPS